MGELHNKYDRETLKKQLEQEDFERYTLSFYRYVNFEDPDTTRDELYQEWSEIGVLGRVYVAHEGINAQITVPLPQFSTFQSLLNKRETLKDMRLNFAVEHSKEAFYKLTIKVRPKIVADGLNDKAFDTTNVGNHLNAEEFNKALESPNTIVVDMRNHYESEVGHFEKAITPEVETFKEELPLIADKLEEKKDQKVLLYCTGGIRCEKASAYLKHRGFKDVNQLHGGIISYAQEIKRKGLPSKFIGKNFVFDERLGERITPDVISHCHQCGKPCDSHVNCNNEACNLLFIQCEECAEQFEGCCTSECQQINKLPEDEKARIRKENPMPKRFNKGKEEKNLLRKVHKKQTTD